MSLRDRVAGVDFSGARDAGKHIWITEGTNTSRGVKIESLLRADALPGSSSKFEDALPALVKYIGTLSNHIIGFDFPFSLPEPLIQEDIWTEFVSRFATDYETSSDFRDSCRAYTGGKELKRRTDVEARVPWCAYNLRLYRQTWSGIRHVLAPLVQGDTARVIPMQKPRQGLPIIAEICPASLLKKEALNLPYKRPNPGHAEARGEIVRELTRRKLLSPVRGKLREAIIGDPGGDALDAVLAAIGAASIEDADPRDDTDLIEARVYF